MRGWKAVGWLAAALTLIFLQDAVGLARHGLRNMPVLVMNLKGEESDYSDRLDAAVRAMFPLGSDERSLISYLKSEGFTPDWRQGGAPNVASFLHDGILCRKIVHVTWQGDDLGRLTQVGGSYESLCQISSPFTESGRSLSKTP